MFIGKYIAKLDYVFFSTNILDENIFQELSIAPVKTLADRFYKYEYEASSFIVRSGKKNNNLRAFTVRVKHDYLPFVLEGGLPKGANISRCDIAIDCDTLGEAVAFVTLPLSTEIKSVKNNGHTFYYGERTQQLYERVYWKHEINKWRYELEIKPQSKKLPAKKWQKVDEHVKLLYSDFLACFDREGRDYDEVLKFALSDAKKQYLDFVFNCEFIDLFQKSRAWRSFEEKEKDYIRLKIKTNSTSSECECWAAVAGGDY